MTLTESQEAMLQQIIDLELKCQLAIVKARELAAAKITEHIEDPESDTTIGKDTFRLALQLISRPFHPFQVLLRAAAKAAFGPNAQGNAAFGQPMPELAGMM